MTASASWQDTYASRLPLYERLEREVRFTLESQVKKAGIKLHSFPSRIKSVESLAAKAERKQWDDPLEEAVDVVGARVVVLYMSDLPTIQSMITSAFNVLTTDDKVDGLPDPSTFGYMSLHYAATILPTHSGPHYEGLQGLRFEIQTRTILMDAWANVSHHLAYKEESSIPTELRRDFHALSGLFYVADKHFELFLGRSREVEERADTQLGRAESHDVELNLETLSAFLKQRYPDRERSSREAISDLIAELRRFGYDDLTELERVMDTTSRRFAVYERKNPPLNKSGRKFNRIGVVRVSLGLHDPAFEAHRMRRYADP